MSKFVRVAAVIILCAGFAIAGSASPTASQAPDDVELDREPLCERDTFEDLDHKDIAISDELREVVPQATAWYEDTRVQELVEQVWKTPEADRGDVVGVLPNHRDQSVMVVGDLARPDSLATLEPRLNELASRAEVRLSLKPSCVDARKSQEAHD